MMLQLYKDPCTHCGSCCNNMSGLPLFPWEMREYARLARLRGLSFVATAHTQQSDAGHNIVSHYTVTTSPCVFYKNGCTIYEDRPLVCRAFPLQIVDSSVLIMKCDAREGYGEQFVANEQAGRLSEDMQWSAAHSIVAIKSSLGKEMAKVAFCATSEGLPLLDIDVYLESKRAHMILTGKKC